MSRYIFKQLVTEWYEVEAESVSEAYDIIGMGDAEVVNADYEDLIFVKEDI
jgi:hypothetical protein